MKNNEQLDLRAYKQAAEFKRIGNIAVREAQEENQRLGIPNVFTRNGVLYYELPNGEITRKDPFPALKRAKSELNQIKP